MWITLDSQKVVLHPIPPCVPRVVEATGDHVAAVCLYAGRELGIPRPILGCHECIVTLLADVKSRMTSISTDSVFDGDGHRRILRFCITLQLFLLSLVMFSPTLEGSAVVVESFDSHQGRTDLVMDSGDGYDYQWNDTEKVCRAPDFSQPRVLVKLIVSANEAALFVRSYHILARVSVRIQSLRPQATRMPSTNHSGRTETVEVPQDVLMATLRQAPTIQTEQRTVEVSQSQYFDRVVDVYVSK